MAGARLFANVDSAQAMEREFEPLVTRLCQAVGQSNAEPEPLLGKSAP